MNESNADRNEFSEYVWNDTLGNTSSVKPDPALRWGVLGILVIIFFSAMGNLLVCLAVCWERRLQNMTNYFLMSLAIADLLVSLIVMPVGMVVELYGYFPLDAELCVLWVSSDVLMCTASIWHMCTMSMDRFFTLKYPMRYGRNKTKTMVLTKILFVWVISVAISSPLCIHGFIDTSVVFNGGLCVPTLTHFVIYGSVFAFYIPLLIMIATYVLTIRILWKNQRLMRRIERSDMRPKLNQINQTFAGIAIPQLITPVRLDSPAGQRVTFPDRMTYLRPSSGQGSQVSPGTLSPSRPLLAQSPLSSPISPLHSPVGNLRYLQSPSPMCSESEDDLDLEKACSRHLLKKRSNSYRTLGHSPKKPNALFRTRSKESITNPSFEAEVGRNPSFEMETGFNRPCEKPDNERVLIRLDDDRNNLTVPNRVFYKKRRANSGLYCTKSATQLPDLCAESDRLASRKQTSLSFSRLDDCQYASAEWECRFLQIQQEMDQCILDAEHEIRRSHKNEVKPRTSASLTASRQPLAASHSQMSVQTTKLATQPLTSTLSPTKNCTHPTSNTSRVTTSEPPTLSIQPPLNSILLPVTSTHASTTPTQPSPLSIPSAPSTQSQTSTEPEPNLNLSLSACESLIKESLRPFCLSLPTATTVRIPAPHIQHSAALSGQVQITSAVSDESDDEDSTTRLSSSPSDTIPIKIQSPPDSPRGPKLDGTVLNGLVSTHDRINALAVSDTDQYDSADNTNAEDDTDDTLGNNNNRDATQPANRFKDRFRATLRASIRRPMTKHLLSKKTASNERKASKVLGIIFLVFVVLWTPFFIMNVLSVSCADCMSDVSPTVMSVILWMGYTASLANPIIYTMFNTAFRTTFIRILQCKLGHRPYKYHEPVHMSCTTMMNSDRRGTMTVVIKDDSR